MSKYEPRIRKQGEKDFFALIVRVDNGGEERVIHGYSRFFKTEKAAIKSTNNYMKKEGLI